MKPLILPIILIALLCAHPVSAGSIHKWVDADGMTHYSDQPPELEETPVDLLEIAASRDRETGIESDYYSIANQWQRLHRERLERDKLALARQQLQRKTRRADVEKPTENRYVAVYPKRHKNRKRRSIKRYYYPHTKAAQPAAPSLGFFPHVN